MIYPYYDEHTDMNVKPIEMQISFKFTESLNVDSVYFIYIFLCLCIVCFNFVLLAISALLFSINVLYIIVS